MKYPSLFVLFLFSATTFADDFVGTYQCTGHDPYLNKDYAGTVTIEPHNTVYKITMQYDTGEKYRATGGPYDQNLLSVVFQDESNPMIVGLEQYHLSDDKKEMGGFWVYLGKDKLGTEVCKRVAEPLKKTN